MQPAGADRLALRQRIDALVAALVSRAAAEGWPVTADHCFLRIAYDNAMGARWDRACPRPAWRHLPLDSLERAASLLDSIAAEGLPALVRLNAASLVHRRTARAAIEG